MSVETLGPVGGILRTPLKIENGAITLQSNIALAIWANLLQSILQGVQPLVVNNAFMISLDQVPVFVDNATALAGGLTAGNLYRSGGDPDVLAIVH